MVLFYFFAHKLFLLKNIMRTLHKKARPISIASSISRNNEFTPNSNLRKTLSHMEEKFTSAAEELQAAEEELAELRVALNKAKNTIKALRMENAVFFAVW